MELIKEKKILIRFLLIVLVFSDRFTFLFKDVFGAEKKDLHDLKKNLNYYILSRLTLL